MKDVYEKNPQMGDPASLASQISQTSQNIERLRGEVNKYEVQISLLLNHIMWSSDSTGRPSFGNSNILWGNKALSC